MWNGVMWPEWCGVEWCDVKGGDVKSLGVMRWNDVWCENV